MSRLLHPSFEGTYGPKRLAEGFAARVAGRIRSAGLYPTAPSYRNRYEVVSETANSVRFRSTNLMTGINIGLNDVTITADEGAAHATYSVSFWTWAKYSLALSGLIGLVIGVVFVLPLLFEDANPYTDYAPGVILAAAMPMVVFWGGLFPWLHIALHKRWARKSLVRILDEINDPGDAVDVAPSEVDDA